MGGSPGVSSAKEAEIAERFALLGIREEDIEESFVRSGGHGGQNVNKTATCVQLKHLPTGIEVKCQLERSQALNRFHAGESLRTRWTISSGAPKATNSSASRRSGARSAADRADPRRGCSPTSGCNPPRSATGSRRGSD